MIITLKVPVIKPQFPWTCIYHAGKEILGKFETAIKEGLGEEGRKETQDKSALIVLSRR